MLALSLFGKKYDFIIARVLDFGFIEEINASVFVGVVEFRWKVPRVWWWCAGSSLFRAGCLGVIARASIQLLGLSLFGSTYDFIIARVSDFEFGEESSGSVLVSGRIQFL